MLSQTGIDFFSTVFIVFFLQLATYLLLHLPANLKQKLHLYNLSTKYGKQCKEVLDFLQQMD
jgi:hypothetical protein